MIEVNNHQYDLCYFDTNALSNFLKNISEWHKYFDDNFNAKKTIICYSAFSLVELWSRQELIEKWIDFFSIYPSAVLDGYESIFQKEVNTYNAKSKISPIVMLPYSINEPGLSSKDALKKVIYNNNFIKKSEYWKKGQNEILNGILSLKKNFPPKNSKYSLKEIEEFKYLSGLYQIAIRNNDFIDSIKINKDLIDINHFQSIVCSMYIVFYKFYIDQRKVQDSDVIDFIIGSILPYVDYFITEGNMMNIIKTIQKRHKYLNNIKEVVSIREITKKLCI